MMMETTGWLGKSGVVLALSILVALSTVAAAPAAVVLSAGDNGSEVTVSINTPFTIELDEQGSTGYGWDFDGLDRTAVDVLDVVTRAKPGSAPVGAPVVKVWTLKGKKIGTTDLRLLYFRPWEGKERAVKSFAVQVKVVE
jgi:predicted secreted protein